ncbi:MAG: hypothetical protein MUO54_00725 [Anaerolineales bacterium]|nr:hypothetical protein [Anaerolineales bacterium]
MSDNRDHLPDLNTLSILVSTILLAYTLTHFVSIPPLEFEVTILGIYFQIGINFSTLVTLLVAGLTASGSAWLLLDHPAKDPGQTTAVHWLLPSLTSLVLMLAIEQLPFGGIWWIAAFFSGFLLILVFIAEYIVLDSSNPYFLPAEMGITSLSIVLFLILAVSLHSAEFRLFYRIPILSFSAALVFLRVIHLRQNGFWAITQGSVSFLLIGEIAAGLHYWPMQSVNFGIALAGPLYALIEISDRFQTENPKVELQDIAWPLLIVIISWGFAILL